jgi:type III secretion protein R
LITTALLAAAPPLLRALNLPEFSGPNPLSWMLLLAAMSIVPFLAVMLTSFAKMSVVLSLARTAVGTQQAPPTVVLTGLAAVLSLVVMAPVGEAMLARVRALESSSRPPELTTWVREVGTPWRLFLARHASPELRAEFIELARELGGGANVSGDALAVLAPAFVLGELKQAFQIGFLVFLPFLVVDMVVANILLALGMQSLAPSQVSLPFKLLLFVAVDGWGLLARNLLLGYRG